MTLIPVPSVESEVDFNPEGAGKPCKTWYTIFGIFPSPTGVRPLICIHGGPGVPHDYLRPIGNLSRTHNIPVIMYDQVGCGHSTHLPEKRGDAGFWTMELFLSELENLISHLGIQEEYDIFGHSWGGFIGVEHAALQRKGLKKLIIGSSSASEHLFMECVNKLLVEKFHVYFQATVRKHEADETPESPEYQKAVLGFYSEHLCRIKNFPDCLMASLSTARMDTTVNHTIFGPYVWKRTGSFKDYTLEDKIPSINVPTLLINGKYDAAQDSVMEPFFNLIEKVKWVRFGESAHTPHLEEPEEFLKVVGEFLIGLIDSLTF